MAMPSSTSTPGVATCDLAIVTALPVELEPVLKLIGGRQYWQQFMLGGFLHYAATFPCERRPLQVVACTLSKYGGTAAAIQVQRLKDLHPRLIVMTGICAGRKEKGIRLGDVIVADRAFSVREGGKQTQDGFLADIRTYNTKPQLLQWLKTFADNTDWYRTITIPRPASLEYQAEWLLCQFATRGIDFPATPADWEELKVNQINLIDARQRLVSKKLLTTTGKLTALANKRIAELRAKNYGRVLPTPDPNRQKAHVNAFASNDTVVAINRPFDEAAAYLRSVGAIEMEVPALYDAAEQLGVWAFAVKGVSDYATPEKDNAFHEYAAEASARWMYAFVCHHAALFKQQVPGSAASANTEQLRTDYIPPNAGTTVGSQYSYDQLPRESHTPLQIRRKALEGQRASLEEEHAAINQQINSTLDNGDRLRLGRKLKQLEQEIEQIDEQLISIGHQLIQIATLHLDHNYDEARLFFQEALSLFAAAGILLGQAQAYVGIALVERQCKRIEGEIYALEQAHHLYVEIDSPDAEVVLQQLEQAQQILRERG